MPQLGDPLFSACDIRALAYIFSWAIEGTEPAPGYMKAERRTLGLSYEQFRAGRAVLGVPTFRTPRHPRVDRRRQARDDASKPGHRNCSTGGSRHSRQSPGGEAAHLGDRCGERRPVAVGIIAGKTWTLPRCLLAAWF